MGRGVMEPEYRGATARRLMREAQTDAAKDRRALEEMEGRYDAATGEVDALKVALAEEKANAEGFRIVGANLSDQLDGTLRENAGIPFLMDMIAEMGVPPAPPEEVPTPAE